IRTTARFAPAKVLLSHLSTGGDEMRRVAKLLGPGTMALLLIGLIAAPGAGAAADASASSCSPARNIEAIVDDSGSMEVTDPNRLRVQARDLLVNLLDPGPQLGAVELGSGLEIPGIVSQPAANPVFAPEPVGPNAAAMKSALDTAIHADNGATDYN